MAASRDSSLLFSLRELEAIEHGRVAKDRAEGEARRETERRTFLEREQLARESEIKRLEEQELRQRMEEARRREEEAHLKAIERAAVERVRAEVDARARLDVERAKEAHELALERERSHAARHTPRFLVLVSVTATLLAAAFAAFVWANARDRARVDSIRDGVEDAERAQHGRTLNALSAARREVAELGGQIERLRTSATKYSKDAATEPPPTVRRPNGVQKSVIPRGARPRDCGLDGDPLNGCLPTR